MASPAPVWAPAQPSAQQSAGVNTLLSAWKEAQKDGVCWGRGGEGEGTNPAQPAHPPRLGTDAKVLKRSWETVILLDSGG